MLLKGRTSCLRPCSSRTHVHDNDWGSWDNAASDLVGVRGPAFALLLALRPYFESERNLEMNTHLGGRQPGHMLRLQLCQPLFYTIHSFPSLVVSPNEPWILAKTRGSASGIGKVTGAKSPAAADLSPDGADWRADTQMNTTPDCGEEPVS